MAYLCERFFNAVVYIIYESLKRDIMEARKRRKTFTIIGVCLAIFSLFFFLQVDGLRDNGNMELANLYWLFGILTIITGSLFVLFGFLKGHHHESNTSE